MIRTQPNEGRPFREIATYCVSANDLINPLPPSLFYGSGWYAYHPTPGMFFIRVIPDLGLALILVVFLPRRTRCSTEHRDALLVLHPSDFEAPHSSAAGSR
jgi:hypothetical protein